MDLSSIEQIIRTRVPNAPDSEVELYLDSVKRDMGFGTDYSDMSEDDIVEDFEFYIQSRMDEAKKPSMKMKKSELKEMIKAAFLSEADFTNAQDDDAALQGMYDPVYEGEEEDLDEMLARLSEEEVEEGNLGHNEIASLTPEGRFWIVSWRGMDGDKEKVFTDEDEARAFMNTLEEGKEVEEPTNY